MLGFEASTCELKYGLGFKVSTCELKYEKEA